MIACSPVFAKPVSSLAAEYYYQLQDYTQALPLWNQVLEKDPDNTAAISRVAELTLWAQGRAGLPDFFQSVLSKSKLSKESRALLKAKYFDLQSLFLNEAAQNFFLQAKHRLDRGDLSGALESLSRAASGDKGQFLILRQKALVEKRLGNWDAFAQTLRLAHRSYPYDPATVLDLAESQLYSKQYDALLEMLTQAEGLPGVTLSTLQLVALVDSGESTSALPLLRGFVAQRALSAVPPVVFFVLAEACRLNGAPLTESRRWYRRFQESVPPSETLAAWDPYRLQERLEEARKYLP